MSILEQSKYCLICGWSTREEVDGEPFHPECYDLYAEAMTELENRTDPQHPYMANPNSVGRGWIGLVTTLILALRETDPDFQIVQIKEKFGGLRFYVEKISRLGANVVGMAEGLSLHTCEECGTMQNVTTAAYKNGGWVKTLCERHHAERESPFKKSL